MRLCDAKDMRRVIGASCWGERLVARAMPTRDRTSPSANSGRVASPRKPDASGQSNAVILTGSTSRVVARFGTPALNDVWVTEYADGGTPDPQAFGRVVKHFRFCH